MTKTFTQDRLAKAKTILYCKEEGGDIRELKVARLDALRISAKTGKAIACFITKQGEYKNLFLEKILELR